MRRSNYPVTTYGKVNLTEALEDVMERYSAAKDSLTGKAQKDFVRAYGAAIDDVLKNIRD